MVLFKEYRERERAEGSTYRRSTQQASFLTLGQPSRAPTTTGKPCCQTLPTNTMSGWHRREDHQYCGSKPNHGEMHHPKDEAGATWKKDSKVCFPNYTEKDREQKYVYVAEKMNNDFEKRRKFGQCFPQRK